MQAEGLQFLPTLKHSGTPHWYLYLEFEESKSTELGWHHNFTDL